jgi:4-hydroxy-tetrahydrodipicolinate synthase
MLDAFPRDFDRAKRLHQRLSFVYKAIFSAPSPGPVKYALSQRGFNCEDVRLPLVKLSDDEKKVVDVAMARFADLAIVA